MDTDEIGQKLKDFFTKGAQASKEAFEKAGDKVQEFSDKSVVRLEKKQLEGKLDNKYAEIGKKVSQILDNAALNFMHVEDQEAIQKLQSEVESLLQEIKAKEDLLK